MVSEIPTYRLLMWVFMMGSVTHSSLSSLDKHSHIPQEFKVVLAKVFNADSPDAIPVSELRSHLLQRRRRSVSSDILINITTDEDVFHVRLTPNLKLLAPGFKVYHRHPSSDDVTQNDDVITENDDVTVESEAEELAHCQFKGTVISHQDAPAAFSLCNGVNTMKLYGKLNYLEEMRMLFVGSAKAEQTYFAIRGDKVKRVDAASVIEAASVCSGKSHFAAKLRICPPRHAAIRYMMPS
ncbi:hypothetical protein DPMN_162891 [Dreissena polymorpha]|uniref:Peptidase M12B propeptide domain-containing protein n=1 Tax=Dreissena polymorpha TaxID=45954 RepID=A0A9D4ISB5_DREPO|nr:hypothetical protein DPMN_162891 [Dreissena polymorpha]